MRLWQKIFFPVLLLYLVTFNGCLYAVITLGYRQNLESEMERARAEAAYFRSELSGEFAQIARRKEIGPEIIASVAERYAKRFGRLGARIELRKEDAVYQSTLPEFFGERKELSALRGGAETIHRTQEGAFIYVAASLSETGITATYAVPVEGLFAHWERMKQLGLLAGIIGPALLTIVLLCFLRRALMPVERLSAAAGEIAGGNYGERLAVRGRDETAELSEAFNKMAGQVEGKIRELSEGTEKKQRFIDNLSHEMRTPLTSVYGYAELMLYTRTEEEEKKEILEYMMKESGRLLKLSKELQALSLLHIRDILKEPVELERIWAHLDTMLSPQFRREQVIYERATQPVTCIGEEALLTSVFRNLLENALNACAAAGEEKPEQERRVTLCAARAGDKAEITVTDTGAGIPEKELERIMEPFYRVDKARSRKGGGTGLGLPLCGQIIKKCGGSLSIASEYGKGTSVTVILQLHNSRINIP